jgi:proteasome lid subunit RPN8/RPN11
VIVLSRAQLKQIADAAESAYPGECCGLLVGRARGAAEILVTRVVESRNIAAEAQSPSDNRDRFEVDPEVRLKAMRELEGTEERIVGLYHSHPDHSAQPSRRDLVYAFEPDLVWVVVAVERGQAVHATAHVVDEGARQFREIPLRTDDWGPYPARETPGPAAAKPKP